MPQLDPRLPRTFYARDTVIVARELIGQRLVRILDGERISGRIVEAEAYRGGADGSSHARSGPTARNAPMFGPPGHSYVYFIYGMHWMFNISAHPVTVAPPGVAAGAVLIRALEPAEGLARMRALRGGKRDALLTNGPARLSQAMAIDKVLNDRDLCTSPVIFIEAEGLQPGERITKGPRVRVPGNATAKAHPWRFWIEGHPNLSS